MTKVRESFFVGGASRATPRPDAVHGSLTLPFRERKVTPIGVAASTRYADGHTACHAV